MPEGARYQATKHLKRAELTALIRAEIKDRVRKGEFPKGRYSLRKKEYAGGWNMTLTVDGLDFPVASRDAIMKNAFSKERPHVAVSITPAAINLEIKLDIFIRSFGFDNSHAEVDHFDVRFYHHIHLAQAGREMSKILEDCDALSKAFPDRAAEIAVAPDEVRQREIDRAYELLALVRQDIEPGAQALRWDEQKKHLAKVVRDQELSVAEAVALTGGRR